ncbi:MAG: hypothetical protein LC667_19485 [Thioalkalivibrio sp.]|nr:hypothetical protein [Thioalkalivibrio sp.]
MFKRQLVAALVLNLLLILVAGCGGDKGSLDAAGLKLGKEVTGLISEAAKVLDGITDLESARNALPQLTDLDGNLGNLVSKVSGLSAESKQSLVGMVKGAMPALESAVSRVKEIPGAGETIEPAVQSMMAKLNGLM